MMGQILAHLWGDYILQSDWMAGNKAKQSLAAFVHALVYSLLFAPLCWHSNAFYPGTPLGFHWLAWWVIFFTHFWIDRFRIARYVVWAKNWLGPSKPWYKTANGWTDVDEGTDYRDCKQPVPPLYACPTGYPPNSPAWLSTWLLIIADNTLHLTINFLALKYL